SLVQVGFVGPSARGEQAQNQIHKLTGDYPFLGWHNQLRDEPVFRVVHERLQRHLPRAPAAAVGSWRWDAVSHWGGSLGNLLTHANVGGEVRWSPVLPDDFGSSPTRPAGERTVGPRDAGDSAFATAPTGHGFVALDARWVLWDISLDGNAFKSSHDVDKENFVVDLGYGFAFTRGPWKIVVARFHRSREFRGQKDMPVFGSVSVSRSF
ncbi:MAG TPA: lipid A deacylase LpxR family protein, partial [Longimicrobium sp.]|nr:lipid A deacylase LpxR family protein [Longimicrobium sp.]